MRKNILFEFLPSEEDEYYIRSDAMSEELFSTQGSTMFQIFRITNVYFILVQFKYNENDNYELMLRNRAS